MEYTIKDPKLAQKGKAIVDWTRKNMPVLSSIGKKLTKEKKFSDIKISISLSLTPETAVLVETLKDAGAKIYLASSNPRTIKDSICAYLVKYQKIPVYAINKESKDEFNEFHKEILSKKPDLIIDDGGELVEIIQKNPERYQSITGATEQTTSGITKAKILQSKNKLPLPIMAVNDNLTKNMFDNKYGTGQSTIDSIMRTTNTLIAGKTVVVCGYGWCGKGIASAAAGLNARVIITEIDHIKALNANMDGYEVMELKNAIKSADYVISATGSINVVDKEHIENAKDGVILAQAGHSDVEINKSTLKSLSSEKNRIREFVDEYIINGKRISLLSDGFVVNLSAADGNPPSVMDMSFAGQVLSLKYLLENGATLKKQLYNMPISLDTKIAEYKLNSKDIEIDKPTQEQVEYLGLANNA